MFATSNKRTPYFRILGLWSGLMEGRSQSWFSPVRKASGRILRMNRMCAKYEFEKPNDRRALDLMNLAAKAVVAELPDITVAYGVSDEFRYVNAKNDSLNTALTN